MSISIQLPLIIIVMYWKAWTTYSMYYIYEYLESMTLILRQINRLSNNIGKVKSVFNILYKSLANAISSMSDQADFFHYVVVSDPTKDCTKIIGKGVLRKLEGMCFFFLLGLLSGVFERAGEWIFLQ